MATEPMAPSSRSGMGDASFSAHQVRSTVLGYLDALRTRADLGAYLSGDVTFEAPGGGWIVRGSEAVEQSVRHHYETEFDARPELVALTNDDRSAAAELSFVGTHTGEYEGLPPTGNAVSLPLAMIFDVEGGLISAIRVYYSPEQLMAQLRPEPASRP